MRQVTLMILTDKELELCRACPNIASVDGKDACYYSDYKGCEHMKRYKEKQILNAMRIGFNQETIKDMKETLGLIVEDK